MKTLIFFQPGLSGNYLKTLLGNIPGKMSFRVDKPLHDQSLRGTRIPDEKKEIDQHYVCAHPGDNIDSDYDLILKILVNKKIYHALYNLFFKKILTEDYTPELYANWKNHLTHWYDIAYYNIREYFEIFHNDWQTGGDHIVNFDFLLEESYIAEIFYQYYNRQLDEQTKQRIAEYRSHQLDIDLTLDGQTMEEIVAPIPDSYFDDHPWFAAYCIFKFERNNNLTDANRLWSIDYITSPINRKILLDIASKYN